MSTRHPTAPHARATTTGPERRRPRLTAVRSAMRDHDDRTRPLPGTRTALGRASTVEARSVAAPWSGAH